MKRIWIVALSFMLGGCADMLTAMSHMNEGMGAQCAEYVASFAGYDNGEYVPDTFFFRNPDEQGRERAWVNQRMRYYLGFYSFNTYYETSPVTGIEYKFNVYCSYYH